MEKRYDGGESVSQSPLKDTAIFSFLDQTYRFSYAQKWNFVRANTLTQGRASLRTRCREGLSVGAE